jgi:hypothetical protein
MSPGDVRIGDLSPGAIQPAEFQLRPSRLGSRPLRKGLQPLELLGQVSWQVVDRRHGQPMWTGG